MYCNHHHQKRGICDDCSNLYDYAVQKVEICPFGIKKPVCLTCTVHCFDTKIREQIRLVMRFSGPKMIFRHPVFALIHLFKKITGKNYKNLKAMRYFSLK